MATLTTREAEYALKRTLHALSFYYGGSESAPADIWEEHLVEVFRYLLTGEGQPAWHREIYGSTEKGAQG